jgi:F-type H+-transporting ATPase subunit a
LNFERRKALTTHDHAEDKPRRIGFKRWIFLGLMILGAVMAWVVGDIWKPVPPAVILPAEPAWPGLYILPGVPLTNTMLSTLIATGLLFLVALFAVQPHVRSGQEVPSNFFYHTMEVGVEFFWNTAQSVAGKWARPIFAFSMSIFLVVLMVNLFKLVPIHETIGYVKKGHGSIQGYETVPVLGGAVHLLNGSKPFPKDQRVEEEHSEDAAHTEGEAGHSEEKSEYWNSTEPCKDCEIVPTFRGAATDLNFTASLAIVTMLMVQVFGVMALGPSYFTKFFNFTTMIKKPIFGLIDFLVGILELISEIAKVLSFSLRLFGVIFAGTLLLSIVSTLSFGGAQPTAFFVPGLLLGLELFVGIIQAYVFSTLALTFMSQATVSHHGDDHAEAH